MAHMKLVKSGSTIPSACLESGKLIRISISSISQETAANKNLWGRVSKIVYFNERQVSARTNSKRMNVMKTLERANSSFGRDAEKNQMSKGTSTINARRRNDLTSRVNIVSFGSLGGLFITSGSGGLTPKLVISTQALIRVSKICCATRLI
jgi:hypothetical protein